MEGLIKISKAGASDAFSCFLQGSSDPVTLKEQSELQPLRFGFGLSSQVQPDMRMPHLRLEATQAVTVMVTARFEPGPNIGIEQQIERIIFRHPFKIRRKVAQSLAHTASSSTHNISYQTRTSTAQSHLLKGPPITDHSIKKHARGANKGGRGILLLRGLGHGPGSSIM